MTLFLLNILVAVLWMFMWGTFDFWTLLAGFAVGCLLLGLVSRLLQTPNYPTRAIKFLSFVIYFLRILTIANLQVARELITPGMQQNPRIIRYPVQGMTPLQITSLANAITLTPGTLSVDVTDDNQMLYVHCMYAKHREQAVKDLDELRDRLMTEVFG